MRFHEFVWNQRTGWEPRPRHKPIPYAIYNKRYTPEGYLLRLTELGYKEDGPNSARDRWLRDIHSRQRVSPVFVDYKVDRVATIRMLERLRETQRRESNDPLHRH